MRAYERLLRYAAMDTGSDANARSTPSTACQLTFAKALAQEMLDLGISGVTMDGFGFVYGYLPATPGCEHAAPLGFIAH
ncbi:MAG: peptidase T, partial [Oscillospiraceae bacterium]|nr:peptidase T [Oscillospiraceae bacterium]